MCKNYIETIKDIVSTSRNQSFDISKKELILQYVNKCFVIIDLKSGKLTHQDVGQMDMYVRIYNDLEKAENDNPTIGIILCADKDKR